MQPSRAIILLEENCWKEAPCPGTWEIHRGYAHGSLLPSAWPGLHLCCTNFLGRSLCIPYLHWKHNKHKNNCTIHCTAWTGDTNLGLLSEELKQFFQPKPELTPHILLMGCQWTDISATDLAPVLSFSLWCTWTECFAHSQFTLWYNKKDGRNSKVNIEGNSQRSPLFLSKESTASSTTPIPTISCMKNLQKAINKELFRTEIFNPSKTRKTPVFLNTFSYCYGPTQSAENIQCNGLSKLDHRFKLYGYLELICWAKRI